MRYIYTKYTFLSVHIKTFRYVKFSDDIKWDKFEIRNVIRFLVQAPSSLRLVFGCQLPLRKTAKHTTIVTSHAPRTY